MSRVGILTSGGDCSGLNAVLRAAARVADSRGVELIGFHDAWRGVLEDAWEVLDVKRCRGILPLGGTILGTSRVSAARSPDGVARVKEVMDRMGLDGFIVIGGDGSLAAADSLYRSGIPTIGVPKTIDNDIGATEMTFGFDTAVHVATEAIDRLHTTAEAHDRIMVLEVMGRHVGHIAARSGLAGGATVVLVPEQPFSLDDIAGFVSDRHRMGRFASIIVVAEGAVPVDGSMELPPEEEDEWGHIRLGGISHRIGKELALRTGYEARVTELGYVQRGGTPTSFDRVLSTRFGVAAMEAAIDGSWGSMVALDADSIVVVPLSHAATGPRPVDKDLLHVLRYFAR